VRTAVAAVAAGALALSAGIWLATRGPASHPPPRPEPERGAAPPPDASARTLDFAPEEPAPATGGAEPPELARHRETLAFSAAVREFFASYPALDEAERRARGDALLAQIEARERSGALRAPEALMLRLGVARAVEDDPAVLESEMRRISDAYRETAQRAAARPPDPRDTRYQQASAEIAREVMAMKEIPGGLTREEYLRERLRDLRSDVYDAPAPPPE
jgi:hypothetical protein